MIQVLAIALGGAVGAVLRYVLASSVSLWLGQSFPYGTLAVNALGSFLIGLMSEALLLERVELAVAFRAGILVGVFGSLTTFSTFAFETLYLLQQGEWLPALLNLGLNTGVCLAAVLIGLLCGRSLFYYGRGIANVKGLPVPYAFSAVNFLGAVLVGVVLALLEPWLASESAKVAVTLLLAGAYIVSSAIYLTLFLAEADADFQHHGRLALVLVVLNALLCVVGIWVGNYEAR